jgi:hypothetical protein
MVNKQVAKNLAAAKEVVKEAPKGIKKEVVEVVKEAPKLKPTKPLKTMYKLTLRELNSKALDIQLKDLFTIGEAQTNLSWDKAIKVCNYCAKETVLTWEHTLEKAFEVLGVFLV